MFEYDENFTVTLLPILKKSIQTYNSWIYKYKWFEKWTISVLPLSSVLKL